MAERRPDRTLGLNHDTFWDWCAKGELRIQRCDGCAHLAWPVVHECQVCGGQALTWERMSGRGKVISWSRFHQDYYRGTLPVPYTTILVELAEGPLFVSNPHGFDWQQLVFELPVRVAFVEAEDSSGTFALPVFERDAAN